MQVRDLRLAGHQVHGVTGWPDSVTRGGAGASDTEDGGPWEGERQAAAEPSHGGAVVLFLFSG